MVNLTIDGQKITTHEGATILDAAKASGIKIPTLCAWPEIEHTPGACRVCMCEVEGQRLLVASCVFPVAEGMAVKTMTERVRRARRGTVELLLASHPTDCNVCIRNGSCELQQVAELVGLRQVRFDYPQDKDRLIDTSSMAIVRDSGKCIKCYRCVTVCDDIQTASILQPSFRGEKVFVGPPFGMDLAQTNCTNCGQCVVACPVAALYERDDTAGVWAALEDPTKHVVVQEAPGIRAALGEDFGMPVGTLVTGKMITALKHLGFDRVFDTNFTADLTIMEEGSELLKRVAEGGTLPMITSCSPGWVKFCEHFYPELLPNLSTCKSPQQMLGALAKTYYAQQSGIDPKNIVVVSIMPCTAKKFEAARPGMDGSGFRDVDYVLTTRELARMIKQAGIDFASLPDGVHDSPLGEYTGAGTLFGATGGVMEAALRTVYAVVTGHNLEDLDVTPVRGLQGVKEAALEVGKLGTVKVAVAHGLSNARQLMDQIREGKSPYAFIEVMCCEGGCISGGGQPLPPSDEKRKLRSSALYADDASVQKYRQSHENPSVKRIYEVFLGKPLGHLSHKLLHTHYTPRGSEMPHKYQAPPTDTNVHQDVHMHHWHDGH